MRGRALNFDLTKILKNPPKLHEDGGRLISDWRIDDATCIELNQRLQPGLVTLETGGGLSTVIFAANGCQHTCVMPDEPVASRILEYCRSAEIDTRKLNFVISKSADVAHEWPRLEFDLILIDGCHGFPSIFVDFYYATKALKTGGILFLDDMHIFTCQLTARFMETDPGWNIELKNRRIVVGAKVAETVDAEWSCQRFVARQSKSASPAWKYWYQFLEATLPLRSRLGLRRVNR
jgi:hypothetical protein